MRGLGIGGRGITSCLHGEEVSACLVCRAEKEAEIAKEDAESLDLNSR